MCITEPPTQGSQQKVQGHRAVSVLFLGSRPCCTGCWAFVSVSGYIYVMPSSLLNKLKGNCFDDGQYKDCTNSHGTKARSWSCHSGLDLDLGLVSFGIGLVLLVMYLKVYSNELFYFN